LYGILKVFVVCGIAAVTFLNVNENAIAGSMGMEEGMYGMMGPYMGEEMMKYGVPMPPPMMSPWKYLKERLDLNEAQSRKFSDIFFEYRKGVLKREAELEVAEMELWEKVVTPGVDEASIKKALDKVESLRTDLDMFRIRLLLKTKEFLSDRQYREFVNFIAGWMRAYRGWRGYPPWVPMYGPPVY